jgi:hypothetical protein
MERTSRPAIATGIALVGAALIGIVPTTMAPPDIQHRLVQLTTAGEINFPEVDWNDFVANTTANWNGLAEMYDHTTAIYSMPEAVYIQGLTQVLPTCRPTCRSWRSIQRRCRRITRRSRRSSMS